MSQLEQQMCLSHVEYHRWATEEMLQSIVPLRDEDLDRDLGSSFGSVRRTLAHMYAVDVLWIARLKNDRNASLASVTVPTEMEELKGSWLTSLGGLLGEVHSGSEAYLKSTCSFRNSTGAEFEMPVWQVLLHVVNHGTAHRGQITGMLRQLSAIPRTTDLVLFYRTHPSSTVSR